MGERVWWGVVGCRFMCIWEWWGKCQGDLLYRVINWMLYGSVSIQGRCDLGEDWGSVVGCRGGFCEGFVRVLSGDHQGVLWGLVGCRGRLVQLGATECNWIGLAMGLGWCEVCAGYGGIW